MYRLTLYTKLNCHLCEEAYRVLLDIINDIPLRIDIIDITRSPQQNSMTKYGHRIPVIAIPGANTELDWPFTADDVIAYLSR